LWTALSSKHTTVSRKAKPVAKRKPAIDNGVAADADLWPIQHLLVLSPRDQLTVAKALLTRHRPNAKLRVAAKRYLQSIGK